MIILEIIILLVVLAIILPEPKAKVTVEDLQKAERDNIIAEADVLSRKARYENMSFATRIRKVVDRNFENYKIIENLVLMDDKGIEHQIPMLCATTKGVILFQTVDYPGKGLFGYVDSDEWQIAQSVDIAQTVPNAIMLSIENAHLIKQMTGIDVKPIVVVSKYTPMVNVLNSQVMGQRVIKEDDLARELESVKRYGKQFYPDEFLTQVKQKLLAMHISDDFDDDEDEDEEFDEDFEEDWDDEDEDIEYPDSDETEDEPVPAVK